MEKGWRKVVWRAGEESLGLQVILVRRLAAKEGRAFVYHNNSATLSLVFAVPHSITVLSEALPKVVYFAIDGCEVSRRHV